MNTARCSSLRASVRPLCSIRMLAQLYTPESTCSGMHDNNAQLFFSLSSCIYRHRASSSRSVHFPPAVGILGCVTASSSLHVPSCQNTQPAADRSRPMNPFARNEQLLGQNAGRRTRWRKPDSRRDRPASSVEEAWPPACACERSGHVRSQFTGRSCRCVRSLTREIVFGIVVEMHEHAQHASACANPE